MQPAIQAFIVADQLPDVTVVADAGMISEANQKQIEAGREPAWSEDPASWRKAQ